MATVVYINEYNTTLDAVSWQKIADALQYLRNENITLKEVAEVAQVYKKFHGQKAFNIFLQEFWKMESYLTATKRYNK